MNIHQPSFFLHRLLLATGLAVSLAGGVWLHRYFQEYPLAEFHEQAGDIFGDVANRIVDYEAMMDNPYDTLQTSGIIAKDGQQRYLDSLSLKPYPGLLSSIQWLKAGASSGGSFCRKWSEIEKAAAGQAPSALLWHLPVPGMAQRAGSRPRAACVGALEARFDTEKLFAHLFKAATAKGMGVRVDAKGPSRSEPDNIDHEEPRIFARGEPREDDDPWAKETNFASYTFRLHVVLSAPARSWNPAWLGPAFFVAGGVLSWTLYRLARRRDERKLQDYGHQLAMQQRVEDISFVAYRIAHDVAQPLTGVHGCLESLLARLDRDDLPAEILRRDLDGAFRLTRRAYDFLMEIRRQIVGPGDQQRRPVAVGEVFRSVAALAGVDSRFHDVNLAVRGGGPELCVVASPAALEMVLLNLLRNSVEAIRDAGRGGAVSLEAKAGDGWVKMLVADDGPGISRPDELFRAFNSTKEYGTGLGLIFCKRQVERLGGSIKGGNRPEGGAWFEIALPACGEEPKGGGVA